jgi:hypothetical protein
VGETQSLKTYCIEMLLDLEAQRVTGRRRERERMRDRVG